MTHQFTSDDSPTPNVRSHLHAALRPEEQDLRWLPESQEETAVIAHLRGWCHLGTICEICRQEGLVIDARATLKTIIEGP